MKKALTIAAVILLVAALAAAQQPAKKLKVFISVDMEGISGLIAWDETSQGGPDYPLFRKLMTEEANAAIAGALDAGATEIVVRDAHDSARNILPDLLRPEARLIREWNSPLSMMEGIDKTFDAVVFIGYHARAGTPNAVLKHTMSLSLFDVILNGVRVPEAAWNAAIAGYFDVPVVFLSGDTAICQQVQEIIGDDRDRRRQGRHGRGRFDDPPAQGPGDDPEGGREGPPEPEGLQALQAGCSL